MTICGGCGIQGTKENGYNPPPHSCPRPNIEWNELKKLADTVEAFFEGGMTEKHVRMVLTGYRVAQARARALHLSGS